MSKFVDYQDQDGNGLRAKLGFSFTYLFFFPIKYIITKRFVKMIIQWIFYVLCLAILLPIFIPGLSGLETLVNDIMSKILAVSFIGNILNPAVEIFSGLLGNGHDPITIPWTNVDLLVGHAFLLVFFLIVHISIAARYNKVYNRFLLRKKYVPITDQDTRVLLLNGVISAKKQIKLSTATDKHSYQYNASNTDSKLIDPSKKYRLEQLEELRRKKMITEEDYQAKVQEIRFGN